MKVSMSKHLVIHLPMMTCIAQQGDCRALCWGSCRSTAAYIPSLHTRLGRLLQPLQLLTHLLQGLQHAVDTDLPGSWCDTQMQNPWGQWVGVESPSITPPSYHQVQGSRWVLAGWLAQEKPGVGGESSFHSLSPLLSIVKSGSGTMKVDMSISHYIQSYQYSDTCGGDTVIGHILYTLYSDIL